MTVFRKTGIVACEEIEATYFCYFLHVEEPEVTHIYIYSPARNSREAKAAIHEPHHCVNCLPVKHFEGT